MCFLLAAAIVLDPIGEVVLEPTDDVWVYSFAEDQSSDPWLRVWSTVGAPVGENGSDLAFSYSCLKFDIPPGVDVEKVESAQLVLTHDPEPAWTKKSSEEAPLEARALPVGFEEESWTYDMHSKVFPVAGADAVYGSASGDPSVMPITIRIDLGKGPRKWNDDIRNGTLTLALTSAMDPSATDERQTYKVASRNSDKESCPKLLLKTKD